MHNEKAVSTGSLILTKLFCTGILAILTVVLQVLYVDISEFTAFCSNYPVKDASFMSIENVEKNTSIVQARVNPPQRLVGRWLYLLRSPLWICLLITLVIRIWFVIH